MSIRLQTPSYNQASRLRKSHVHYDFWLIITVLFLTGLGLVMVTSSSITVADRELGRPLYFFWRQLVAVGIGIFCACVIIRIPLFVWQYINTYLLASTMYLFLPLIPDLAMARDRSTGWRKKLYRVLALGFDHDLPSALQDSFLDGLFCLM